MANFGQVNQLKDLIQKEVGSTIDRLERIMEDIADEINTDPIEALDSLEIADKHIGKLIDTRLLKSHLGEHVAVFKDEDIDSHPSVINNAGNSDIQERMQKSLLVTQSKQKEAVHIFDNIKNESAQQWEHIATGQEHLMNSVNTLKSVTQTQLDKGIDGIQIDEIKNVISDVKGSLADSQKRLENISIQETAGIKMNDHLSEKANISTQTKVNTNSMTR